LSLIQYFLLQSESFRVDAHLLPSTLIDLLANVLKSEITSERG
jgi:hypothetical protein